MAVGEAPVRRVHIAIAGAAILLLLDVTFYILDCDTTRIKLSEPRAGIVVPRDVVVTGYAWDRSRDSEHTVQVIAEGPDGARMTVPAPRDAVRYGDRTAFQLVSFSADLVFTTDGEWTIVARMTTDSGNTVDTAPRSISVRSDGTARRFIHFSALHLLSSVIVLAACVAVAVVYRGGTRIEVRRRRFELVFPILLWLNEGAYHIYWYVTGGWNATHSLLIQMCGISILFLIFVFHLETPRVRWLYELIFFWGLGGAIQAILAPDIGWRSFPDYRYFSFFISHGMIMVGGVYIVVARGFRPTIGSPIRVFVITNGAVLITWGLNLLFEVVPPFQRGNYFMTGFPPPTGSIIDLMAEVFGPAPRYLVGLELMGMAVFLLMWAPFALNRLLARRKVAPAAVS
jgi:hypothetical integral membrane protein (TIGR02206 family)